MTEKLSSKWLSDPRLVPVFSAMEASGFQAYFVGGCVRNALLGREIGDIDMACDATPTQMMALFEKHNLRAIPTGFDHGTVTVVTGGLPIEMTSFRRDMDTDGRHATVAFSRDIHDDACRRDFTMNALYASKTGEIIDPLQGLPDLLAGHLRFIGSADARIREDYLRILRFFRFTAWYGAADLGIDQDGLAACAAQIEGLAGLARERIGAEVMKLLAAPAPQQAVAAMGASGVLNAILPGADVRTLLVLSELESGYPVDPLLRLAALGGQEVASRLCLTKKQKKIYDQLLKAVSSTQSIAGIAYRTNRDLAQSVALLRGAVFEQALDPLLDAQLKLGAGAECPVRARDLSDRFAGAALGTELRRLEALWIASGFTLDRRALLRA